MDPRSIDADADLRLCGMDSLKWADLCEILSDEFGVFMSLEIDRPTLNGIAANIRSVLDSASNGVSDDCDLDVSVTETVRLTPQHPCQEIPLAHDDLVPTNILLVLAFEYDVSDRLIDGIARGLEFFPHLAGRLVESSCASTLAIQPDHEGVLVERRSNDEINIRDLCKLSRKQLIEPFFPTGTVINSCNDNQPSLLSIRITTIEDGCVVGILASHRAVDGTGLGLFLGHCMGGVQHVPIHDRDVLITDLPRDVEPPAWYVDHPSELGPWEWELAESYPIDVFTIHEAELRKQFSGDRSSTWFQLTAILCEEFSTIGYREAAFWCDVRGSLGIPRTYTGNVGCYWHEAIGFPDEDTLALARRLRAGTGDRSKVASVYSAVKQSEFANRPLRWTGTAPHVLPINLVPHFSSMLNFGRGGPVMTRILTRNVHGLRISRAPGDAGFLVEVCLPSDHLCQLKSKLANRGIRIVEFGS